MASENFVDVIDDLLRDTYICRAPLKPEFGVHATFYKQPLLSLEEGFMELLEHAEERIREVEGVTHPNRAYVLPPETTLLRVYGYWDTVAIKYTDDFATIADGGQPNLALAEKSFYGYLLATNSGVTEGKPCKAPLREVHQLGHADTEPYHGAVLSHFKINPLLLYSGRTDLILYTATFIALVFAASADFWQRSEVRKIVDQLLKGFGEERRRAVEENLRRVLPKISSQTRDAKFFIFQDLDWNDFSCYIAARTIQDAVNISSFIRSLPLLMPNLAFRFQESGLRLQGGASLTEAESMHRRGRRDLNDLTQLILRQEMLPNKKERSRSSRAQAARLRLTRSKAFELPVFWSHVDTVVPPKPEPGLELQVRLAETVNARPGQTRRLLAEQEDPGDELRQFYALSGPKDLFRFIGEQPGRIRKATQRRRAAQKWTYVFGEIDTDLLYEGPEDIHELCDGLGVLLSQKFDREDWKDLNSKLGELGTPRQLTFSIRHLVLAHLAYKNDALMFNALYDYQHLWRNLRDHIGEVIETRKERPDRANIKELLSSMSMFVEKVGQAINTRYHGSSRMFEVRDLSLNHRGGVDAFLDAYSQLVRAALAACNHIHHASHHGIVNVTATPWPQVSTLFGCVVEIDWLRLSNPETLFIVLHELGHQILSDKIFVLVRNSLPSSNVSWADVLIKDWKDAEADHAMAGRFLSESSTLFADIFCDLFMLHVVRGAVSERNRAIDDLLYFYDRWYWVMLECHIQQSEPPGEDGLGLGLRYMATGVIRWMVVRRMVRLWEKDDWVDDRLAQLADRFAEQLKSGRVNNDAALELADQIDVECRQRRLHLGLPEHLDEELEFPRRASPTIQIAWRRAEEEGGGRSLADMVHAGLQWHFRVDEEGVSPAQHFLNLSQLLLTTYVDRHLAKSPAKRRQLWVLGKALDYCKEIFRRSVDQCTDELPCYAQFNDTGPNPGSIKEIEYTDVFINSRGTPLARGGALRLKLFRQRLAIFNRLAKGRLQTTVEDLIR